MHENRLVDVPQAFNLTLIKIPYYAKVNGGAVVGGSHKSLTLIPTCVLPDQSSDVPCGRE